LHVTLVGEPVAENTADTLVEFVELPETGALIVTTGALLQADVEKTSVELLPQLFAASSAVTLTEYCVPQVRPFIA
jgi:hypothetical protein